MVPALALVTDTPAGKAVSAWLEAFNSGDRARLDDYFKKYEPSKHADDFMGFRDRVGGFDLLSIEKWAAFYTPPSSCEHPDDWKAQVECGNLYIRAKKRFEEQWATSEGTGAGVVLDNGSPRAVRR